MNRKIAAIIISLICLALIGLMVVQLSLLNQTAQMQIQTFRSNVNNALSSIVQKLENREFSSIVFKLSEYGTESQPRMLVYALNAQDTLVKRNNKLCVTPTELDSDIRIADNRLTFHLDEPKQVEICVLDSNSRVVNCLVDTVKSAGKHEVDLGDSICDSNLQLKMVVDGIVRIIPLDLSTNLRTVVDSSVVDFRRIMVEKIISEVSKAQPESIEERIDAVLLDSLTHVTLQENGIHLDYAYGISASDKDSLMLTNSDRWSQKMLQSEFRTRLFPHDVRVGNNDLILYFPDQAKLLFQHMGFSGLISLLFILVIAVCFILVFRTVFQQKKFYMLLVDFINNMTHEFKTPISTISLASETITKPVVIKDAKKIIRYGEMIKDESSRMRKQVEKILEMAALEKGEFELNIGSLSVHEIIQNAVDKFSLTIEKMNGSIQTRLNAENDTIAGDAVHLANVIFNLFDNGVKYSPEKPIVVIKTQNDNERLIITFQDNGIGIKPDDLKKIFDKYYRVPTGNLHDVKGFGLGLSYVKLIVEAFGGQVKVNTELGKGSEFIVDLPLMLT